MIEPDQLALLIQYAMDSCVAAGLGELAPPADPHLAPDWRLVGHLVAQDAVFHIGSTLSLGETVCYGYVAQSTSDPDQYVAAIRGTADALEWFKDSQFILRPHPVAGRVETGFGEIYDSMRFAGLTGPPLTAAHGIAELIGPTGRITVTGHSLGAPLAIYLTFDLQEIVNQRVSGCYFASPRPGDQEFVAAFDEDVADYAVFDYMLDLVPHVPLGPDYAEPKRITWITPATALARIKFDLGCNHDIASYAAMLGHTALIGGCIVALNSAP
jgi:hypothetical protein